MGWRFGETPSISSSLALLTASAYSFDRLNRSDLRVATISSFLACVLEE